MLDYGCHDLCAQAVSSLQDPDLQCMRSDLAVKKVFLRLEVSLQNVRGMDVHHCRYQAVKTPIIHVKRK